MMVTRNLVMIYTYLDDADYNNVNRRIISVVKKYRDGAQREIAVSHGQKWLHVSE